MYDYWLLISDYTRRHSLLDVTKQKFTKILAIFFSFIVTPYCPNTKNAK